MRRKIFIRKRRSGNFKVINIREEGTGNLVCSFTMTKVEYRKFINIGRYLHEFKGTDQEVIMKMLICAAEYYLKGLGDDEEN